MNATIETEEDVLLRRSESGPSPTLASLSAEVSRVKDAFHTAYAAFERTSRFTTLAGSLQASAPTDAHGVEIFMEKIHGALKPQHRFLGIARLFQSRSRRTRSPTEDFCLGRLAPEDLAAQERELQQTGGSLAQLDAQAMRTMDGALTETRRMASSVAEKIRTEEGRIRQEIAALVQEHHLTSYAAIIHTEARLAPFQALLSDLQKSMLLPSEPQEFRHHTGRNGHHPDHKNGHGGKSGHNGKQNGAGLSGIAVTAL